MTYTNHDFLVTAPWRLAQPSTKFDTTCRKTNTNWEVLR